LLSGGEKTPAHAAAQGAARAKKPSRTVGGDHRVGRRAIAYLLQALQNTGAMAYFAKADDIEEDVCIPWKAAPRYLRLKIG